MPFSVVHATSETAPVAYALDVDSIKQRLENILHKVTKTTQRATGEVYSIISSLPSVYSSLSHIHIDPNTTQSVYDLSKMTWIALGCECIPEKDYNMVPAPELIPCGSHQYARSSHKEESLYTDLCLMINSYTALDIFIETNINSLCLFNETTKQWMRQVSGDDAIICDWLDLLNEDLPAFDQIMRSVIVIDDGYKLVESVGNKNWGKAVVSSVKAVNAFVHLILEYKKQHSRTM